MIYQINTTCNQASMTFFIRAARTELAFRTLGDHIRGFFTIGEWRVIEESQVPQGVTIIEGRKA